MTSRSMPAAATERTLRRRICSPARRTNCLGISAPKRLPSPPARRIAWIRISRACLGRLRPVARSGRVDGGRCGRRGIIASRKEGPLSHPSRQDAGFDAPRIDLLSLAWERVQWIIEARPAADDSGATAAGARRRTRWRSAFATRPTRGTGARRSRWRRPAARARATIFGCASTSCRDPARCHWHPADGGSSGAWTRRASRPSRSS